MYVCVSIYIIINTIQLVHITENTQTWQPDVAQPNQQYYELLKILKFLKLKITTHSYVTYYGDSPTILARVYTLDDGQVRPKHVVIIYMKDEIKY
jgi:hypothetical protein